MISYLVNITFDLEFLFYESIKSSKQIASQDNSKVNNVVNKVYVKLL